MAAETPPIFLQAGSHDAEHVRRFMFATLAQRGGIVNAGDLAVTQNGSPNMTVNVAAGQIFVPGTESANQGIYYGENRTTLNLAISAADSTNPRIDLIVARVRDAGYSGATNTFTIEVLTGTPAASPPVPTPAANEWVIAQIAVAAGATSIVTANITDKRTTYSTQTRAAALGGIVVCTSSNRPSVNLSAGQQIFETDTGKLLIYTGSAWNEVITTGAWTANSPLITQAGFSVSATTTYGKYTRIGRTIHLGFDLAITGTGTTNNAIKIGLPVAATGTQFMVVGSGAYFDTSTSSSYYGVWRMDTSTTITLWSANAASAVGIVPNIATGSGDTVSGTVTYEASS